VLLDHFVSLKSIRDGRERKLVVEALLRQPNLWAARKKSLSGYLGGMRQDFGSAVGLPKPCRSSSSWASPPPASPHQAQPLPRPTE